MHKITLHRSYRACWRKVKTDEIGERSLAEIVAPRALFCAELVDKTLLARQVDLAFDCPSAVTEHELTTPAISKRFPYIEGSEFTHEFV